MPKSIEIPSLLSCLPLLSQLETLIVGDEERDSERPVLTCGMRKLVQQLLLPKRNDEDNDESVPQSLDILPTSLTSLTLIEMHIAPPG